MFHNQNLNNRLNLIHGRNLKISYQQYSSTNEELYAIDGFFKSCDHNLQKLLIEVFKSGNEACLQKYSCMRLFSLKSVEINSFMTEAVII